MLAVVHTARFSFLGLISKYVQTVAQECLVFSEVAGNTSSRKVSVRTVPEIGAIETWVARRAACFAVTGSSFCAALASFKLVAMWKTTRSPSFGFNCLSYTPERKALKTYPEQVSTPEQGFLTRQKPVALVK